jgi:hypothetical protein
VYYLAISGKNLICFEVAHYYYIGNVPYSNAKRACTCACCVGVAFASTIIIRAMSPLRKIVDDEAVRPKVILFVALELTGTHKLFDKGVVLTLAPSFKNNSFLSATVALAGSKLAIMN